MRSIGFGTFGHGFEEPGSSMLKLNRPNPASASTKTSWRALDRSVRVGAEGSATSGLQLAGWLRSQNKTQPDKDETLQRHHDNKVYVGYHKTRQAFASPNLGVAHRLL